MQTGSSHNNSDIENKGFQSDGKTGDGFSGTSSTSGSNSTTASTTGRGKKTLDDRDSSERRGAGRIHRSTRR